MSFVTSCTYASTGSVPASAFVDGASPIERTTTAWGTLYPSWDARFVLRPIATADCTLRLGVFDNSRLGPKRDEHIGDAVVPMSLLLDQRWHRAWVPIRPVRSDSPDQKRGVLSARCALRVEVCFTFSRARRLYDTVARLERALDAPVE